MKNIHVTRRGFTLIELLVVIGIIALLSSIVLTSLQQSRIKARDSQANQMIIQYQNALALYASDNGNLYPPATASVTGATCLGDYSDKCGPSETVSENSSFNNALDTYIKGTPPVNDRPLPGPGGHPFTGALYNCMTANAGACQSFTIVWVLEGDDQSCGPGKALTSVPMSNGGTYCSLTNS